MKYIVSLQFTDIFQYFIRVNKDTWDEVYSPKVATRFKTKKAAKEWGKSNTTFGKYINVIEYDIAVAKFQEWQTNGYIHRTFNIVNKTISRPYTNETSDEILAWWLAVQKAGPDSIRYEDYKTWPNLFSVFPCLWNTCSYYTDEDDHKLCHSVSIRVSKTTKFSTFLNDIKKVIDYITYLDEGRGKIFSVFDHFLSEYGNSVTLVVYSNKLLTSKTKAKVQGRYFADIDSTLEECFEYLRKERYYND